MYYKLPTTLYCEKNCIKNHADEICSYGKKAYIITGKNSSKKNNSLSNVTSALKSRGVAFVIYDNISENPSIENIIDAVEKASTDIDFVVGIGGGSALDAAKAVSLMLASDNKDSSLFYDKKAETVYLPVIMVPTTCGTGSEVTPYSILTIHNKRTKASLPHRIYPELALIDPVYLMSAPDHILKNTAVDALGHLVESYINPKRTDISSMFCEKGLSDWCDVYKMLKEENKTYEIYEKLMMVSAYAGMAISHTGTSLPHGLSYAITYEHNVPHGKAIGTFVASYVEHADNADKKFVLNKTGFGSVEELSKAIRELVGDVTLTASEINTAVTNMLSNEAKLASCPYKVDEAVLRDMFAKSVIVK